METQVTTLYNREHKDRLFKFIFGKDTEQSKRWRLQLYNALNGTNYTDPDALKINTIENVIFITMHNDISFLVDTEINLYEEQSSRNPNMPLRGFFYFAILYQQYLKENKKNLLSEKLVQIPTPKFFVFYHGGEKDPDSWKMRLSDAFFDQTNKSGDYEWTATVINLHPDHNSTLNKNCTPLYHYVKYISMITANKKAGMDNKQAIEKAVEEAIKENLLEGFFKIHRAKVIGMCLTEYDEEEFKRVCREDGYTDGLAEGEIRGAQQTIIDNAKSFYANGAPISLIANSLHMTEEQVKEIVQGVTVTV